MKRLFLLCVLFLVYSNMFSQSLGNWKAYTSMLNVKDFHEVDAGLWAVTDGGIFYFNQADSSYKSYTKTEGLSSHNLTAIVVDSQNKVWVGAKEGFINVISPDDNVEVLLQIVNSNKINKRINHLAVNGDTIFVSTDFGISLINSKTLEFIDTILKFGQFPAETAVNSLTLGNNIYVSTDKGVAKLKSSNSIFAVPESWDVFDAVENFASGTVQKVIEVNNDVYAATSKGIYNFNNGSWSQSFGITQSVIDIQNFNNILYYNYSLVSSDITFYVLNKIENGTVTTIVNQTEDEINKIKIYNTIPYYSGKNGIVNISNMTLSISPNGPLTNNFISSTVDDNGQVWIGSGSGSGSRGVHMLNNNFWTNLTTNNIPEFNSNNFHKVYSHGNKLYFSNWGSGFTVLNNNVYKTYNTTNTTLQGIVNAPTFLVIQDIKVDKNNNVWLLNEETLSNRPLNVMTPDETFYHYVWPSSVASVTKTLINHLVIDQFNTKWFAVVRDGTVGLYYFNHNNTLENTDDDDWGILRTNDGLESNSISALAIDKRGELWIGTPKGVNIIPDPSRPKSNISRVFSLREQAINCITVDPINRKWIGTDQGLFLISNDGTELLQTYTIENSPLPTNSIKSIAFDGNNGLAYIGTERGLLTLSTEAFEPLDAFEDLFVFPNPFILGNGGNIKLQIDGLIKDSSIKIFSIEGKLIKEYDSPGGRRAEWDGRDDNGKLVASGVYLISAYDKEINEVKTTKVAIVRK